MSSQPGRESARGPRFFLSGRACRQSASPSVCAWPRRSLEGVDHDQLLHDPLLWATCGSAARTRRQPRTRIKNRTKISAVLCGSRRACRGWLELPMHGGHLLCQLRKALRGDQQHLLRAYAPSPHLSRPFIFLVRGGCFRPFGFGRSVVRLVVGLAGSAAGRGPGPILCLASSAPPPSVRVVTFGLAGDAERSLRHVLEGVTLARPRCMPLPMVTGATRTVSLREHA